MCYAAALALPDTWYQSGLEYGAFELCMPSDLLLGIGLGHSVEQSCTPAPFPLYQGLTVFFSYTLAASNAYSRTLLIA